MAETYSAGVVTAYGAAVRGGYTGTYEEFCAEQADFAENAAAVAQAKSDVETMQGQVEQAAATFTDTTVPAAVTTVQEAGAAQVQAVQSEGTMQAAAVETVGAQQTAAVGAAGSDAVDAVEAAETAATGAVTAAQTAAVQAVTTAQSTAVAAVQAESTTQLTAIQTKGEETIASIPEDYTALTEEVNDVKSATSDNFVLTANDFESGTIENGQKVNWGERLRTKQFYTVRRNDTVVWTSTTLQINICVYPSGVTSLLDDTGWSKSTEPKTYTVPVDGVLFILVKKEAGGSISINDYSGVDITINSSLQNRIDRLTAENGYIIRYYRDIDFEQGTFNGKGVNDDGAYNKTRKMRSVTPAFLNKGDVITVLNQKLRAYCISTSTIDNSYVNSGWITDTFTIPSTGFYRLQYGLKNDNNLNTSFYDFYEQGIVIKSKSVNVEEAIYKHMTGITTEINSTHGYSGEAIDLSKNVFSIKTLTPFSSFPSVATAREGSAYYNGTLFKLYANNYVELYNYATMEKIAEYSIDGYHGNGAEFSDEFYSASDEYPLLYIADGSAENVITVNRVTNSGATLVRKLSFPESAGYFLSFGLDSRSQKIYTIGYLINNYQTAENNGCILCAWDLTKLTDNGGSYTPAFISKTTLPFIDTKQDSKYFNGKIYQISSSPNASSSKPTKLYVIGLDGVISNIITDFNEPIRDHEMEGICFVPDDNGYEYKIYIDGVSGTRFELLF